MKRFVILLALIGALATGPGSARAVREAVTAEASASAALLERAELVRDLIVRARADKDVAMMIVASNMLKQGDFVLVQAENAPLVIGRARRRGTAGDRALGAAARSRRVGPGRSR